MRWQDTERTELDAQLSPSLTAKDAAGVLQRHVAQTAALAEDTGVIRHPDIAYGAGARQTYDLTCPPVTGSPDRALPEKGLPEKGLPVLAFLHGGFWQEGSKSGSGFAARALAGAGWAHAAIGYSLAPQARLADIVAETGAALRHLHATGPALGLDPDRIVLAGHSAGAHLAASVMCGLCGDDLARAMAGYVLISGVYELGLVARSYVNDAMRLTPDDIATLSPLRSPAALRPGHILIGRDEPDAFQRQSDAAARHWQVPVTRVPGRDHFDILDELSDPGSTTFRAILTMGTTT